MAIRPIATLFFGLFLWRLSLGFAFLSIQRKSCFLKRQTQTSWSFLLTTAAQQDNSIQVSDEEFRVWLTGELEDVPGRQDYNSVYEDAINAILQWRMRYRGNPKLWQRIFKKERVIKELVEAVPIIDAVQSIVKDHDDNTSEKITIVDLASGKGFLSMFLSEMLPPNKVEKMILIDKAWPLCNTLEPLPHQMNWDHIYGNATNMNDSDTNDNDSPAKTYFETWPIPLHTSKQNLKQKCNKRQLKERLFDKATGPILILAIHLCGTLSLKAIDMFNEYPNVVNFIALKPCCLPPMIYAQRNDTFAIGRHTFDAKEVCSPGKFVGKTWHGPPRWNLEGKFNVWADHLYQGIDVIDFKQQSNFNEEIDTTLNKINSILNENEEHLQALTSNVNIPGRKEKRYAEIQVDGGYQNTYIFAQRTPFTKAIWTTKDMNSLEEKKSA